MDELNKMRNAIVSYLREPYLDSIGLLAESKADIGLMRDSGLIIQNNQTEEIYSIINSGDHNLGDVPEYEVYSLLQKQYVRELIKHYKQHPDLIFASEGSLASLITKLSIKEWHNGTRLQDLGVVYYFYSGRHQGLPTNTLQLPNENGEDSLGADYGNFQVLDEDSYTCIELAVKNQLYKKYPHLFEQVSYERWLRDMKYLNNIKVYSKYPYSRYSYSRNKTDYTLTKERLALNIHQLILTYKDEMSSDEQGLRLLEALTNLKKGLEGYYELKLLKEQYTHRLDELQSPLQSQPQFKTMSEEEKIKFRVRQAHGDAYNKFRDGFTRQMKRYNKRLLEKRAQRLSVGDEQDDLDELLLF